MNNELQFERKKNLKALGITVLIITAIFFIFFFISWTYPQMPPPPIDEGIEVNLGNSDEGLGDIAPSIPDEASVAMQTNFNSPPASRSEAASEPELEVNNEPDAPIINTSTKPEKKPVENKKDNVNNKTKAVKEVVNPTPVPPRPKAVYAGGSNTATGGNNGDSYNNSRNQGVTGGNGDQGKANGTTTSDNYTGNGGTGTSGVSITNGLTGRRLAATARFEDEYKYGGKVLVFVTVNESGTVTSAKVQLPSPFADINAIALRRAQQLRFTKGSEIQSGVVTIIFQTPKG